MRVRKRTLAIAALAVAAGLPIAGILLLRSSAVQHVLISKASELLAQQGLTFDSRDLQLNLWNLSLTLRSVSFTANHRPNLPPLLTIQQVDADLDAYALLRGRYIIESATIAAPRLHLVLFADGSNNLPRLPESKPGPTNYRIHKLKVNGGSALIEDRASAASAQIPAFTGTLDFSTLAQRYNVALAIPAAQLRSGARELAVTGIDAALQASPDFGSAHVQHLRAQSSIGNIELSGDVSKEKLDAAAKVMAQITDPVSGTIEGTLGLTGTVADPKVSPDLTFTSAAGKAHVVGVLSFDAKQPTALHIQASSTLTSLLSLAKQQQLPLASDIALTGDVTFPGLDYQRLSGNARLLLRGGRGSMPLSGDASLRAANGTLRASVHSLQVPGMLAKGDLQLTTKSQLDGRLTLEVLDAAQATALYKEQLPPIAGRLFSTIALSGKLNDPQATIHLDSATLDIGQIRSLHATGDLTATSRQVTIERLDLNAAGQQATIEGTAGFQAPHDALDLRASIQQAGMRALLSLMPTQNLPIDGLLSASAKIGGTLRKAEAELSLQATSLVAWEEPLGDLQATANLKEGRLTVPGLVLQKSAGTLRAAGHYDLTPRTFSLTATLAQFQVEKRIAVLLSGKANVQGSLDQPDGRFELSTPTVTYNGTPTGPIAIDGTLRNGQVEASAKVPELGIEATARRPIHGVIRTQFEGQFRNSSLATLAALAGQSTQGIEGRFSATAQGAFTDTDTLATAEGTAAITAFEGQWRTLPVNLSNGLKVALTKGIATIEPARLQLGGSNLEIAGAIPVDAKALIPGLTAKGVIHLADLAILVPQHIKAAEGELQIDAAIRGSLGKPQIESSLLLANGTLHPTAAALPFTGIQLEGNVEAETLRLNTLAASFSSGKITGHGTVPLHLVIPAEYLSLPAREPARFSLAATQLPLEALPGVPPKLQGTFSVGFTATAPSMDMDALEASIHMPDAKLRVGGFDIELAQPATARLRKSLLQLDSLELKGPETLLRTRGYIRTAAPYAVNLSTDGNLDIALLTAFLPDWTLSGASTFQFAIRGSLTQPTMAGYLQLKDGLASTANPSLDASGVSARLKFEGNKITLESLKGELNGGTFDAQGGLIAALSSTQSLEVRNVDLRLKAANIYMEPVTGLKTLADATLHVEGSTAGLTVTGDVTAQEGSYDQPVTLEQALLSSLRGGTSVTTLEDSAAAIPIALNVAVRTLSPLQINNNLMRAAIDAELRVRGTTAKPGLTGRLTIDEGGQLFLNERTYTVERGSVVFTDERRIAPTLDIAARTRVNEYDITLRVQGPPGRELQTSLLSDPPLPEPDVLAVLATGRRLEELEGSESAVVREQVLSYLAGAVGGGITQKAGRAVGLSQVRIEPSLIASETEPTARLTIGQDFTRQLGLVYSMNLRDSSDQIWIGKYDITRRFTTRAIRQSDETYRLQFQHDLQFGGRKPETQAQKKRSAQTVTKITITGDSPLPKKDIEGWLGLRASSRYDFFKLRKGMERIREEHAEKGYLEVRVTNTRQERPAEVELTIDVKAGPHIELAFEGWDPSRGERKALRDTWRSGSFESLRLRAIERKARQQLSANGYLQATVEVRPRTQGERKIVLLETTRGVRYSRGKPRFTGIPPERERALVRLVEADDLAYSDPARAAALIRDRFFREGFLDAEVKPPAFRYDDANRTALATFDIKLGPQYRIGDIQFAGAGKIPDSQLRARLPFLSGAVYTPELDNKAIDAIFQAYGDSGYTDAQIEQRLRRDPFTGIVHIAYEVVEGPQRVVSDVQIAGNQYTSDNLIRTQLSILPGDVLYDGKIAQARRNLYTTGAFTIADVEVEPLATQPDAGKKLVRLNTKVQEVRPFEVRYGGFYDTERGWGGIADLTNRNMLGGARTVGFRTRYDSTLMEARAYYDQPTLLRFPVKTTATLFARRESDPQFFTDRLGASINGEYRFRNHYRLDFGYRLEQTHTFERVPDELFPLDARLWIAPLTGAISRDTRDEILDATRGSFSSHAVEYSPQIIDRQLTYVKYYGQYFLYRSFGGTREVPWAGMIRPRFTYAGGVRLGLATGLGGQDVTYSERFFAGGANTVRGFERNFLGPLDFKGLPEGGNAVAIVNQELRFPLYKMVDGVTFFDAGNVSPLVSRFRNDEWRKAAGFGLRLRTPYVLLRVDYGFKLGRRPGESAGQFFFSIGQAF